MADEVLLVVSTFPHTEEAARIAEQLVTGKLAACANILPAVRSIYRWQGKLEDASETMVLFKTTQNRFADFQRSLRELHSYEVPEIVAFRVADGLPEYLAWVSESCVKESGARPLQSS